MTEVALDGAGLNRIGHTFGQLSRSKRVGLIPFITAGYPTPALTLPLMHTLVAAGADLIELGVPFSDPMADGPIIQRSSDVALGHGVSLRSVIQMVADFRLQNQITPVVLMGYLNPIEKMGYAEFAEQAAKAGVDAVLVVDLPLESEGDYSSQMKKNGLDKIFLLAPNTSPSRAESICKKGAGFLYYVALKGVTGAGHLDTKSVADRVAQCRSWTNLPVAVGFGINDAPSAQAVAAFADAVVVGSALIRHIETLWEKKVDGEHLLQGTAEFLLGMRRALDGVEEQGE